MDKPSKPRFDRELALRVAKEIGDELQPATSRLVVAGSLRRGKATVGDVEIVYIPKEELRPDPKDLFASIKVNRADEVIADLEASYTLVRRKNVNGSEMFGPKNKLMGHRSTGIPVDLFSADEANWWNYLVCRTGPAESNTRICMAAQARGWKWNPYGPGFSRGEEMRPMHSEEEVFEFVGLPYLPPEERA